MTIQLPNYPILLQFGCVATELIRHEQIRPAVHDFGVVDGPLCGCAFPGTADESRSDVEAQ